MLHSWSRQRITEDLSLFPAPTLALHQLSLFQAPLALFAGAISPVPAPTPVGQPPLMNGVATLPPPVAPPAPHAAQSDDDDEDMDEGNGAYEDNMQVVWPQ